MRCYDSGVLCGIDILFLTLEAVYMVPIHVQNGLFK